MMWCLQQRRRLLRAFRVFLHAGYAANLSCLRCATCCDIDLFQAADAARPEGVKDTDLVAIYGGTHGIANGLHNALNAAEVLKSRGREDIKIVLIGSGIKKKGLVADAKARNLTNVIFMDPMPKTVLAGYFKGADIGLQLLDNIPAFYYGTSPNKFFDYIATGKPVVNNYPGWVADLVTEHQCGWTVAPDAPDAFADALEDAHARKADLAARNAGPIFHRCVGANGER